MFQDACVLTLDLWSLIRTTTIIIILGVIQQQWWVTGLGNKFNSFYRLLSTRVYKLVEGLCGLTGDEVDQTQLFESSSGSYRTQPEWGENRGHQHPHLSPPPQQGTM